MARDGAGGAQSVGYLLAATGPVIAGYLAERTGNRDATLIVFAVLAAVQVVIGIAAGRDRRRR
ncbi:hypothetical protein AB0E63_30930 [Kribbella sp. NPDC026596]|uniref:hypothetical protein n=1 Tax=Kribbella sp. NPDC026596 TaxID=3155122 RepID=UPI0033D5E841